MFNQKIKRLGFACMIVDEKGKQKKEHKIGTLTQKKMYSLSEKEQFETLKKKLLQNISSLNEQIKYVSNLPEKERMFRISSTLLPMYDHQILGKLYEGELKELLSVELLKIGNMAREKDIRLSMHPDQFCVLNSDKPEVVKKSLNCIEMHGDVARYMGFGKEFQDFKINVHLNGKTNILPMEDFSETIRNCLTLENDEKLGTTERLIEVCHKNGIAMVFDIHHHWCGTEGEYMDLNSDTIKSVIETWKGVRPTMHLSQSVDRIWSNNLILPDMNEILLEHKKGKTFAHSQLIDNKALVKYMLEYNEKFDIMIEAKLKNQAVKKFIEIKNKILKGV